MKKLLVFLFLLLLPMNSYASSYVDRQLKEAKKNAKYNTVDKRLNRGDYTQSFSQKIDISRIKDPELIKLSDIDVVSEKNYEKKIAADNKIYEKDIKSALKVDKGIVVNIEPRIVDFYKIYRIAERIIRANNLEYTNWRFAIRKTVEDYNAYSTDTNLVVIQTALYDSIYTSDDALAFVIAHEMAHNLLGHHQRQLELDRNKIGLYRGAKTRMNNNDTAQAIAKLAVTSAAAAYSVKYYKEMRMMEYMADSEGLSLIIKAGYDPNKALYAIDCMKTLQDLDTLVTRTHPMANDRMKSAQENIYYANPMWVEEGKYNIYKSNVLPCKKSSDHVSIVISRDNSISDHYQIENIEQKLTRLAYVSYKKGDMKNAIKYFEKLTQISQDFVPYLYLSYANEYMYELTNDKSYLNKSKEAIKKASLYNNSNRFVKEQVNKISDL